MFSSATVLYWSFLLPRAWPALLLCSITLALAPNSFPLATLILIRGFARGSDSRMQYALGSQKEMCTARKRTFGACQLN